MKCDCYHDADLGHWITCFCPVHKKGQSMKVIRQIQYEGSEEALREVVARSLPEGVKELVNYTIEVRTVYSDLPRQEPFVPLEEADICNCDGGPQGEGLVSLPHEPTCPAYDDVMLSGAKAKEFIQAMREVGK